MSALEETGTAPARSIRLVPVPRPVPRRMSLGVSPLRGQGTLALELAPAAPAAPVPPPSTWLEEDEEPPSAARLVAAWSDAGRDLDRLLATAPMGERLRAGALVVLAGRPNAGKSSLFNALLGSDRALVTAHPGTTRDAVEAGTTCDGWPVRLVDTAGLHDATHELERLGVAMSRRYLEAAEVLLLCVEATGGLEAEVAALATDPRTIVVRTKTDLVGATSDGEAIATSAVTGEGLDRLRSAIAARAFGAGADALSPTLLRARHRDALARARAELDAARPHLDTAGDPVLAAHHVRAATAALEELMGAVTTDDVLGRLFASFCVGK